MKSLFQEWIDGAPTEPGTYWILRSIREGLATPELWVITAITDDIIFGELGERLEFIHRSGVIKYYPEIEESDDYKKTTDPLTGWIN